MPSPYSAGSIFLQVVPSFRGVPEQIAREAREWGDEAGKGFDERFEKAATDGAKKTGARVGAALQGETGKAGEQAGKEYAGRFKDALNAGLKSAQREVDALRVDVDDKEARKKLTALQVGLKGLEGNVKIGMDSGKALLQFQKLAQAARDLQDVSKNLEFRSNIGGVIRDMERIAKGIQDLSKLDIEPDLKVDRQLGLFERRLRDGIRSALDSIPPVRLDDSEAQAQIAELRERLFELADVEIGVDVDSEVAFAELARVEAELRSIADTASTMDLRVNAAGALRTVAGVRTELEALSRMTIEPELQLDRQMGAFERGFRGAVENALRDLGAVDLPSDPRLGDAGQRAVADLRKQLFDLGDLTIGVDISAETARETLARIRDELEQLQREHWSVQLDADTAAAAGQLAGFLAALEAVDHEDIDIDVELKGVASVIANARAMNSTLGMTDATMARLSSTTQDGANSFRAFNARVLGVAALGPLVVPVLGSIGAAALALGPLAAAGAAGLGVLGLAVFGIGDAFKAMGESRVNAARDMQDFQRNVAQAARGVTDAQRALGRAQDDAGRAAEDSARRVRDAEQGVAQARQEAAEASERAARQVEDAQAGVADAQREAGEAAERAARQVEDAAQAVTDAEEELASALRDSQRAQDDLTLARAEAAEQMEDLTFSVRGGILAERDAVLDLRKARADLAAASAEGATGDELDRYILRVDQAQLALDRTRESNEDLRLESEEWARSGVEGSDRVTAARERVLDASERIEDAEDRLIDAQETLANAQRDQARVAEDGQRRVAEAQRAVADAQANQARVALDGQRRIVEAEQDAADARRDQARQAQDGQRAIEDAQRNLSEAQLAYSDALAETSTSQQKLNEEMAKLGPAGQSFVRYLDGLRPRFNALRSLAQEGLLPGLTDWIDSMVVHHGPLLESTVGRMSTAVGRMFSSFGESIRGEQFTALFQMIDRSGPTFIRQIAEVLRNLGEGVASLIVAMEPLGRLFGEWLVNATARFNQWASNLRGTTGLQEFFMWVERVGPKVADFFWEFGDALLAIGRAIAPFAERMLEGLTSFLDWVSELPPNILGPVTMGILGLTVALQAIFGLTALMHSFRSAWHLLMGALGGGAAAGAVGGAAGGLKGVTGQVGILALAFGSLYSQSSAVRDIVDSVVGSLGRLVSTVAGAIPNLTGLASTVAIVAAAWKGMDVLGGAVQRVGTAATNAAPGLGVFVSQVSGSDKAGTTAMGTMGKLGTAMSMFGRALPVVGIGLGIVGAAFEASSRKIEENRAQLVAWMNAQDQGGAVGAEASRNLQDYRDKVEAARERLEAARASQTGAAGAMEGYSTGVLIAGMSLEQLEEDLRVSTAEYEKQKNMLTETQLAQAEVTAAQANLQEVLKNHPPTSEAARAAAERLETAERNLAVVEGNLELAVSGVNQELLTRQGIAIGVAQAQMQYEQSVNALKDAHQRYLDVLADPDATEEQARQALEAWHNQALATAESAKNLTLAKYAHADANVREQMGNATLLASLEEQKRIYGELPPALETLRTTLSETVPEPYRIAAGFEALQLEISETPNSKGIVVTSTTPEQIALMESLGLKVTELPDGQFLVEALTEEAQRAIDEIVKPRTIEITASIIRQGTAGERDSAVSGSGVQGGGRGPVAPRSSGGAVFGPGTPTSDSILARLSTGEFVVKAASVDKYGLGFLNAVNSGRFQLPGFRNGGLVIPTPTPRFAEGGYVASYGGTINLSGGAIPELASWWVSALQTINEASSQAATHISRAFSTLRSALLGNFADTHTQATSIWGSLFGVITGQATGAQGVLGTIFGQIRDTTTARSGETEANTVTIWGRLRDAVLGRAGETRDQGNTIFGQMRDLLFGRGTETRDQQNTLWSEMRDLLFGRGSETRDNQNSIFGNMRDLLFGRSIETRDQQNTLWSQLRDNLFGRGTETRDQQNGLFGGMRDLLFGRSDETRNGVTGRFTQMRDTLNTLGSQAVSWMQGHFNNLPGFLANGVNTVIDKVLNNGLFKAFNSVVGALGLDVKLNIPTATQVRLAAGGKVPGYSPNDKADNIPAMLTAGEWVQPVDSVRYYGPEFMEAIRKRRIPREFFTEGPQYRAEGGAIGYAAMSNLIKKQFPWARITSTLRPGDPGYHGKGLAIDIGGARPYPDPTAIQQMLQINRWIAGNIQGATELIHTAPGAINLWHGKPHTYNAATRREHANHVHWAQAGKIAAGATGLGGLLGAAMDFAADPAGMLREAVNSALGGFETSPITRIMASGARKLVDFMADKVTGLAGNLFSLNDAQVSGGGRVSNLANEKLVQSMAAARGWTGGEWNALRQLVIKESGFNNTAQNPTSTAFGMFQFLNSTWAGTGIAKTADPRLQTEAGFRYIASRYGMPSRALAFHLRNNWYGEGGEVRPNQDFDSASGAIIPDLHDTGGWVMPGLNVLMNRTGRPEPVINPQTLDALIKVADGGGARGPLIGELNLPMMASNPHEAVDEVLHHLRVYDAGGRYGGTD